jgi:hypothetical protein
MNQFLRDRILRRLDTLSDERAYQVLDFVEFLESKYAERQSPSANVFQRFAETVEDKLRAGRVSAATISETMGLMNRAMGVLSGVAAAGKSVASDIVDAANSFTTPSAPTAVTDGNTPPAPPTTANEPPGTPPPPPSGETR